MTPAEQAVAQSDLIALEAALLPVVTALPLEVVLVLSVHLLALRRSLGMGGRIAGPSGRIGPWVRLVSNDGEP